MEYLSENTILSALFSAVVCVCQDEEGRDSLSGGGAAEETHPGDVVHR